MKFSELELPSNRKFGTFISIILAFGTAYYFFKGNIAVGSFFAVTTVGTAMVTMLKDDLLSVPNKIWMTFGLLLGHIISPVILAVIFFGIFTPVAIVTRLFNRDELRLKPSSSKTHWIQREQVANGTGFKQQF